MRENKKTLLRLKAYLEVNFGMRTGPSSQEQKSSLFLTPEENEIVFSLLGPKCMTLATTVVELYCTRGRYSDKWEFRELGVLCLVKDNNKRSYFFRIFCPVQRKLIWEHEVYNNLNYLALTPYLHVFEAEECITGFNFADEDEGAQLRTILLNKLEYKRQRRERRSKIPNNVNNVAPPKYAESNGYSVTETPVVNVPFKELHLSGKKEKKRLTKADIGTPQNFRHVSHVGWDPQKGFEVGNVEDPELKEFFAKAGVSECHLKDKATREFIYDFINKNGGMEAVKEEIEEKNPPLPSRGRAPPPPPSRAPPATPPPPPPPPPIRTLPPRIIPPSPKPSTPPSMAAVKPPPPPPVPPPPPGPPLPPSEPPAAAADDSRSALMQAIRSGTTLKPVGESRKQTGGGGAPSPSPAGDSRRELLNQIEQGVELKSVTTNSNNSNAIPTPQNGLAGALARALAERSRAIYSDSSDSSDEEAEEDWDD